MDALEHFSRRFYASFLKWNCESVMIMMMLLNEFFSLFYIIEKVLTLMVRFIQQLYQDVHCIIEPTDQYTFVLIEMSFYLLFDS